MFDVIREALRAADEGTVKYMVEEQQKEIVEQKKIIAERDEQLTEQQKTIAERDKQLAEKDGQLGEQKLEIDKLRKALQKANISD